MAWMRPALSQTRDVAVQEVSIGFLTTCLSVGTSRDCSQDSVDGDWFRAPIWLMACSAWRASFSLP